MELSSNQGNNKLCVFWRGERRVGWQRFRFVGLRNEETETWELYVANVPADCLPAEAVAKTYRARWSVELLESGRKTRH